MFTREPSCEDPINKLHYSAKYTPICVYCAEDVVFVPKDKYPKCEACIHKQAIIK